MAPDINISADGDEPIAEARQALSLIDADDVQAVDVTLTVDGGESAETSADGGTTAAPPAGPDTEPDPDSREGVYVKPQTKQHAALTGLSAGDYRDFRLVAELAEGDISADEASDALSTMHSDEDKRQLLKRRKDGRGYEYLLTGFGRQYRDSMPAYVVDADED